VKTDPTRKITRVTGEDRKEMRSVLAKQYARGASLRALAAEHGRSYGFVHRLLTEDDTFQPRSRGGANRKAGVA
jgi:Helix-turn-helix domain